MSEIIDGVSIKLAGKDYNIPPLSFRQLRVLRKEMSMLDGIIGMPDDKQMGAVVTIVHAALSRNYPDITNDQVFDMIDLGNLKPTIHAIMGISGLTQGE